MQLKERNNKLIIGKDIELFLSENTFLTIHNYANHKVIIGDSDIPYRGFKAITSNYFHPDQRDICLDIFFLGNLYCAACKAQVPIDTLLSHKTALAKFFKATNTLPEDYTFGTSNISFTVKQTRAETANQKQRFQLRGRSKGKNFIAGTLIIGETTVVLEDVSKNYYTLEPSIDLFRMLFYADEKSRSYLLTSLVWILLVKQGFSSYPGKDIFHYPLPQEKTKNRFLTSSTDLGTYTLTSFLLKNV